eukprot:5793197-Pyramimonas_sp.AAC.1
MLLSLLQGNLPRAGPVVRMAISDYHRLEPDVVDNKVEKHFHHYQRGTLLRDRDYQTGHGSMCKSVCNIYEALTPAR